ncbi:hypothetical protein PPYR_01750 [Photinus pyralis]|uniref:Uncharacterized protein n=1 Tax=Photinus pyralis TaxID=7054 RepID=A0A5N4B5Z8_PHOPY|nr:uncharacterized protein LOC116160006 [Photinus pyralis]KAB0804780.1 hypothetical protein PPYR_01750 [Photinus pyralis]
MKRFTFLIILCVVVAKRRIPEVQVKQWERIISSFKADCIEEANVDPILVERMVYELEFPEDEGLKKYWRCTHNHFHSIKANHNLDGEQISNQVPFVPPQLALQCTTESNHIKDLIEKAFEGAKCIINKLAV